MKRIYLIVALFCMMMVSCNLEGEKATVETREVTDVTINSARVICNVADDGGAEISLRGVCWGTSENPTIETASSLEMGSGIGNYECEISGLNSNTTYYVRAFAKNRAGISYGEEQSFKTLNGDGYDGEIAGHGYIDLGLPSGLKWATCNVGSSSFEEYGDYFAWGEIKPKTLYNNDTYMYWTDVDGNGYWDYGESIINSDITGNTKYDAATANWGGSWRMPTSYEIQELIDHCEFGFTQVNDVWGMMVVGPNGSCIFLPAAGIRDGDSFVGDSVIGEYWSSTMEEADCFVDCERAHSLFFNNGYAEVQSNTGRVSGLIVRPVTE